MDGPTGISPAMLADQALQSDLVRRKLEMDSLKKRLGDTTTKEEKLRESCEGFEAIFLQKMWEQMRKTVPKEGYLHSKDEEMCQSLFDVELCKKMAGAGGIGLADMLYEQLSQKLADSSRTTSPGSYRVPLEIAAAGLSAGKKENAGDAAPDPKAAKPDKILTAEDLYSPLDPSPEEREGPDNKIMAALHEFQVSLGKAPAGEAGEAVREWAEARDRATGITTAQAQAEQPGAAAVVPAASASASHQPGSQAEKSNTPGVPLAATDKQATLSGHPPSARPGPAEPATIAADRTAGTGPENAANGKASTTSEPTRTSAGAEDNLKAERLFGRRKPRNNTDKAETSAKTAPAHPRGMVPEGTLWPLGNQGGTVVSRFGWEDDKTSGRRRWNSGVRIVAPPQSPVRAVLDGTVVYAGDREGFGHTVVLEHKNGFRSYYSNLTGSSVRVGDKIGHGAEFAKIGIPASPQDKGENSASLYFELKKGEMALNPENAIERPVGMATATPEAVS